MRMAEARAIGGELGKRHRNCVLAWELRGAGLYPALVARLVARGDWQLLWPGTYLCAAEPAGALVRATAALRHAEQRQLEAAPQPRPAVTGLAGAAAMGMRWVPTHTRVQVLVGAHVRRASYEGVLVRRAFDLAGVETWSWGGLPVAHATRLVIDGARECTSLRDVRGLALGAAADGWTSATELLAVLDQGAVPSSAWARRAARDIARGALSPPEAEVADFLIGRRMAFALNVEVRVDGALLGVADGYVLGTGVGYEVDSVERHSGPALAATLDRHERASRGGVRLVHVTPSSFRADPHAFLSRLVDAIGERRARGIGDPPGLTLTHSGPVLR